MKINLHFALFLIIGFVAKSQDIHFTNNRFTPLQWSPATFGSYEGNLRAGGIYRSQFSDFIVNPYETTIVYGDITLDKGFRASDWTGVGIQVHNDVAGDLAVRNTGVTAGLTYHYTVGKNYKNVFSLGASYTMRNRSLDVSKAIFPESPVSGGGNDYNKLSEFNALTHNINGGLQLTSKIGKYSRFQTGVSFLNILNRSFIGITDNVEGRRWNVHAICTAVTNNQKNIFDYGAFYSGMSGLTNISLQFSARRNLKPKIKDGWIVGAGVGYRIQDAMQMMALASYKRWNLSIAYDLTVSQAKTFNNSNGAIELALYKIFVFNAKPNVKPVIFCPRL
jgi:type IX secretion system PorP/SprF family membrane protein